jgi:hypothetical protein
MTRSDSTPVVDGQAEDVAAEAANEIPEGATEGQRHPDWCDPQLCTWRTTGGGAHHSRWVALGPLANKLMVRAYLFATDELVVDGVPQPLVTIAFGYPIYHPVDIAENGGIDEDTAPSIVLPVDQFLQLNGFLDTLAAAAQGLAMPRIVMMGTT